MHIYGRQPSPPPGRRLAFPVIIAPMAMQRLCHPDGELATARAAAAAGITMCVSTMATASVAEVAEAAGAGHLWFQIYVLTRRDITEKMIREAEAKGYTALVITVDAPRLGEFRSSGDRARVQTARSRPGFIYFSPAG